MGGTGRDGNEHAVVHKHWGVEGVMDGAGSGTLVGSDRVLRPLRASGRWQCHSLLLRVLRVLRVFQYASANP